MAFDLRAPRVNGASLEAKISSGDNGLCRIVCEYGGQAGDKHNITTTDNKQFQIGGQVRSDLQLLEITAKITDGQLEAQMCTPLPNNAEDIDVDLYNNFMLMAQNP